jgi:hypothetical protein
MENQPKFGERNKAKEPPIESNKFGWLPIQSQPQELQDKFNAKLIPFQISGPLLDLKESLLYKVVNKAAGYEFFPWDQKTGSCVGQGALAVMATLQAVEIITEKQTFEEWRLPFILYNYGQSRKRGGLNGEGEGSFGSSMAESLNEDGCPPLDPSYPQPIHQQDGSWTFGAKAEMDWSNGNKPPIDLSSSAKSFKVKSTSKLNSSEEVKQALSNGYPVTIASSWWGFGEMKVKASGTPAVQLASRSQNWGHQQSCLGFTTHPDFGLIFLIQNSWGNAHGTPPGNFGEPKGSYWIKAKDMDRICFEEVFSFSNFDGYPARTIDWSI